MRCFCRDATRRRARRPIDISARAAGVVGDRTLNILTRPVRRGLDRGRRIVRRGGRSDSQLAAVRAIVRAQLTGRRHRLPDFLIIGAAKCGTTALYYTLARHPGISPVALPGGKIGKEVHYFDSSAYRLGEAWYRSHFPRRSDDGAGQRELICGEATPSYLFLPEVPARVAQLLPRVTLVALLRDPIDRAYSHWAHRWREGDEKLDFESAVAVELEHIDREPPEVWHLSPRPGGRPYLAAGIYLDQIRRWHAAFPRERLLILGSEEYFRDPAGSTSRVMAHLGAEIRELPARTVRRPRNYPPLAARTRDLLREFYRDHNERLFGYLGQRFDWSGG
jgi:Sulfotransferase domain